MWTYLTLLKGRSYTREFVSVFWQKTLSIVDVECPVQYSEQFGLFIALSIFRKACDLVLL